MGAALGASVGVMTTPSWRYPWPGEQYTPLFELSLAPWSLMRRPHGQEDERGIDLMDYPMTAKELGFDFIEIDNLHFPGDLPAEEDILRFQDRCKQADIKCSLLLCGALGDAASANKQQRQKAIRQYKAWIKAAAFLGCEAVRIVCADRITIPKQEKMKYALRGVKKLVRFAARQGVDLLIENHNGYSSDPDWLVSLIKQVDHPRCGILADFTEWRMQREPLKLYPDPYRGMELLAPYTLSVGAKSIDFDAKGEETKVDYFRMMKILTEAGFRKKVAVEYFGESLSRKEGIIKTKQLLERVRNRLS